MIIIGCDFHTRYQTIAMLDEATGELTERAGGQPFHITHTNAAEIPGAALFVF
ncbi:MAG: hypothetical protein WCC97_01040 [Candidatus Acidiferrales bacterium]